MLITKQEFDALQVPSEVSKAFQLADNLSASLGDILLSEGIGNRITAKPYVIKWVLSQAKYAGEPIKFGERGITWVHRNTAAERATNRILSTCFPSADTQTDKPQKKAAPVKFTRSQRSACDLFLAEFPGKSLAEQIKQARALLSSLEQ